MISIYDRKKTIKEYGNEMGKLLPLLVVLSVLVFISSCEAFFLPDLPEPSNEVYDHFSPLGKPIATYDISSYIPSEETIELDAPIALSMEINTGALLFKKNIDQPIAPASLTKIPAALFALDRGALSQDHLDQIVLFSADSWAENAPPESSLMFLGPNQRASQLDLFKGLMISSGNDAARALTELVSGTPSNFIAELNQYLEYFGLNNTFFMESSGYSPLNQSTARELSYIMLKYINEYPWVMDQIHNQREFTYPRRENSLDPSSEPFLNLTQRNRNLLIGNYQGANGLKTGYIEQSGYHIAASAKKNGMYILVLIMGVEAENSFEGSEKRARLAQELLDWSFRNFSLYEIDPKPIDPISIWASDEMTILEMDPEPYVITLPNTMENDIRLEQTALRQVIAPVYEDQKVAYSWIVNGEDEVLYMRPHLGDRYIAGRKLTFFEEIDLGLRDLFFSSENRKILELGFEIFEQIPEELENLF